MTYQVNPNASPEFKDGWSTYLERPCPVTGCGAEVGQECWCSTVLRATGEAFGPIPPHFIRVLPHWKD